MRAAREQALLDYYSMMQIAARYEGSAMGHELRKAAQRIADGFALSEPEIKSGEVLAEVREGCPMCSGTGNIHKNCILR